MPVKKTTTKKAPAKTTTTKKKPTTKKTTVPKKPTVIVKENPIKKISSNCIFEKKGFPGMIIAIILILNTILLCTILAKNKTNEDTASIIKQFEIEKVGWEENYKLIQEIYSLDIYKLDQKRRLETVLQQLKDLESQGKTLPQTAGNDLPMVLPSE